MKSYLYVHSFLASHDVPCFLPSQIIYRIMGAKVGKRVYWPGTGIYCLDPEMLEIGDDVVFGSRSEFLTTDGAGTAKIVIGPGGRLERIRIMLCLIPTSAMVSDRIVALPGTRIGRQTIMGSGAVCKRDTTYGDGETWLGNGATSTWIMTSLDMLTFPQKKEGPFV